jgi:acyl-lipid omega-6 desaturase (Delta-12 desaturase)
MVGVYTDFMEQISSETSSIYSTWQKLIAPYQTSDLTHSIFQMVSTLLAYFTIWGLMIWSLKISYWLTSGLVILATLFLIRIFIIFHDCGHGSFFKSKTANRWVGFFLGVLTFTPSEDWWHEHAIHHATAGNLDKRGTGDVTTLTVDEYRNSSLWNRLTYRVFRHPLAMFIIGPVAVFFLRQRLPSINAGNREKLSVLYTDMALAALFLGMGYLVGWQEFLVLQLAIMWLAAAGGIWLFYVQHQFENVYWRRDSEWDYVQSAFLGASCYRLPAILEWFSGNIGYHHIHHLSPRIPNYNLKTCYLENPPLQQATLLNLHTGLKSLSLRLWDEKKGKMVGFAEVEPAVSKKA